MSYYKYYNNKRLFSQTSSSKCISTCVREIYIELSCHVAMSYLGYALAMDIQ